MLFGKLLSGALLAAGTLLSVKADDLPEIEVVGNKFFYSNNGSRFYIKGVAYQQDTESSDSSTFVDPLSDGDACKRDIPYLQELDTNVIRVYALNVSLDHTECMELLQDAGIYVIADLSEPDESIDRDDPEWNIELFDRYTGVVDLFQNYTNILGFFAGNEVTNSASNTDASPFVKAAIRDTKAYIKEQGYRTIPVGYSSNDDSTIRVALADYFACGDEDDRADFFGINMYEWCSSDDTYSSSGYKNITELYSDLGIPAFFSEYGCNTESPRTFSDVTTLYGDDMTDVWSGGIVYMYFEESNDYGLVTISDDEVLTLEDFTNLKSQLAKIDPSSEKSSQESATTTTTCPTTNSYWSASTELPPVPDDTICNCMKSSLKCVIDSDVDSDDYEDLFSYICAEIDCGGIEADGENGTYGAYSMCDAEDQLSFVMNLYYIENDSESSACSFSGLGSLKLSSVASSCSSILSSAGTSGEGTVSGTIASTSHTDITDTTDSDSTSTSSSSSSSSSSGGSKQFSVDLVTKSMCIGVAVLVGAGLFFA